MKKLFVGLLIAVSCALSVPSSILAAEANMAADQAVSAVNINDASPEELQQLAGVGSAISQRIVDYRENVGQFQQPQDLMKVKGIGQKTMDKIRPMVAVE
ncbi:MAG: helix-hairpin-helix domain-containing protein [Desulfuromonadales bacterium]